MTHNLNRRDICKLAGAGLALPLVQGIGTAAGHTDTKRGGVHPHFSLGLASYSLRKFDLDQTLAMTRRVGLKNIAFKSMHLPLDSSPAQIDAALAKVKAAGLNLYGAGVVYMKRAEQVHQAFDYARAAGMKVIIGVPGHDLLPLVEEKVKAYDIKVAIHNHGPGDKLYPTPASIMAKVEHLDPRIGMCMDIGHTVRIGADPVTDAERFRDRLHDVHIKDVTAAAPGGKGTVAGHGVIDLPRFLACLIKIDYREVVSFEYEEHADDPMPGLAESVGYVRGVLATL
jgi:sugar phosphate isomerase/epimerase